MIRVLVIDDHPIVRDGLMAILEDQLDLEVVGAVGSAEQGVTLARSLRPDVALLDLELPDRSGVEAIPQLIQAVPDLRVVVFTAYLTDDHILGAIRSGAQGYLLKGASAEEIVRAIRIVHEGGSHLDPHVTVKVMAQLGKPQKSTDPLSAREHEVLRLVAAGFSNKQIAYSLSIAERTVKFHVTSIFQKLDADNRAQAVALALQRGLLS